MRFMVSILARYTHCSASDVLRVKHLLLMDSMADWSTCIVFSFSSDLVLFSGKFVCFLTLLCDRHSAALIIEYACNEAAYVLNRSVSVPSTSDGCWT
jgi:hypothetical protein